MGNELVIFGSQNLNGKNCHINRSSDRYSSPIAVSTSPYSRAAGSVVNNTRPTEKEISFSGYIQSDTQAELQDIVDTYERCLAYEDSLLRISPQWETLYGITSSAEYTSSQGTITLTAQTLIGNYAIRLGETTAADVEIVCTATSRSITEILAYDINEDVACGSLGFWVKEPFKNRTLEYSPIKVYLGSNASNYQVFIATPYDGRTRDDYTFYIAKYDPFHASAEDVGDAVTSGSYTYLKYEFNALFDGEIYELSDLLWIREKSTRNYPAIKTQFQKSHEHHSINKVDFGLDFLNYTGLAIGSYEYVDTEAVANYDPDEMITHSVDNTGTYSPVVRVDVSHVSGDGFGWGYRVNDGQYVTVATAGTATASDSYSVYSDPILLGAYKNGDIVDVAEGIIPTDDWVAGANDIELYFIEDEVTISQPTYNASKYIYRTQPGEFIPVAYAQSFTANSTGWLYRVDVLMSGRVASTDLTGSAQVNVITGGQGVIFGDPFTANFSEGSTSHFVVSNTPQWVSFFPATYVTSGSFYYLSVFNSDDARLYTTSTSSYAGGYLWSYANIPGDYGFTPYTAQDMAFKTYIQNNTSFTANYSIYYRNRYL